MFLYIFKTTLNLTLTVTVSQYPSCRCSVGVELFGRDALGPFWIFRITVR
jgi:hypothetical protein